MLAGRLLVAASVVGRVFVGSGKLVGVIASLAGIVEFISACNCVASDFDDSHPLLPEKARPRSYDESSPYLRSRERQLLRSRQEDIELEFCEA